MTVVQWAGNLCGGLLGVAVVVAWWEHVGRKGQAHADDGWAPSSPRAVVVGVDVDVDLSAPASPNDATERRVALDSALVRAARRGGDPAPPPPWLATAPMIAAALRAEIAEPKAAGRTGTAGTTGIPEPR